jgi:chromosome segregation ATPase
MTARPIAATLVALGFALGSSAFAQDRMTRDAYKAEKERIEADYKAANEACKKLSGNAEDVCKAQAKADQRIAEAELDAKNKGTAKARADARIVRAEAQYDVAKEKCDELSGNAKDACVKDAKAAEARAKAEAKADRADARDVRRPGDTRADASTATRDAEYRAATARCDAMTGDARTTCLADAKRKYARP